MKKILIPISFSEASANALRLAVSIAEKHDATLSLMHCYSGHSFNRKYDFGAMPYDEGIRHMLSDFYSKTMGSRRTVSIKLLSREGSAADTICEISKEYELLILSRNPSFKAKTMSSSSDKISYFITRSKCPVLVLPSTQVNYKFFEMKKIWHIEQKKDERVLINRELVELKLDPKSLISKSLNQHTFTSVLWKDIVDFTKSHKQAQLDHISEIFDDEHIDLLVLVNQRSRLLESFLKGDVFSIFSQYNIPILTLQNR